MWTEARSSLPLEGVSTATLHLLAAALRNGQLAPPVTTFAIARVTLCPPPLAAVLERLSAEGLSCMHMALLLEAAVERLETRLAAESLAELVWTGPETANACSRDTAVVVNELFSTAQQSITVSTYAVHQPELVFRVLGERLDAVPDLTVRVFVHIERTRDDTREDGTIAAAYGAWLAGRWPGARRPRIYYDPRGLSRNPEVRASWHAKCVVVDGAVALVTSANFTEWAHERNVEAGVLVRSPHFARQLLLQFDDLVRLALVCRLPGF